MVAVLVKRNSTTLVFFLNFFSIFIKTYSLGKTSAFVNSTYFILLSQIKPRERSLPLHRIRKRTLGNRYHRSIGSHGVHIDSSLRVTFKYFPKLRCASLLQLYVACQAAFSLLIFYSPLFSSLQCLNVEA